MIERATHGVAERGNEFFWCVNVARVPVSDSHKDGPIGRAAARLGLDYWWLVLVASFEADSPR